MCGLPIERYRVSRGCAPNGRSARGVGGKGSGCHWQDCGDYPERGREMGPCRAILRPLGENEHGLPFRVRVRGGQSNSTRHANRRFLLALLLRLCALWETRSRHWVPCDCLLILGVRFADATALVAGPGCQWLILVHSRASSDACEPRMLPLLDGRFQLSVRSARRSLCCRAPLQHCASPPTSCAIVATSL
jgi:hypothetical protein